MKAQRYSISLIRLICCFTEILYVYSSDGMMTRLQAGEQRMQVRFLETARDLYVLHNIQTVFI
jgi:hypothetical protein